MFLRRLTVVLVVVLLGASGSQAGVHPVRYVCSPCGLPCDTKVLDKAGTCPDCGMPLVTEEEAKARIRATPAPKKVAILIFDGVEIIDFTGPYEVFGAANFDVYTVAPTKLPITTSMGMTVVPKYSIDDAPQPDVLVVPGGGVKAMRENARVLGWIRDETATIGHTMSVCNGAFILADAGLLDGLSATTTNGNIPKLKAGYPKINVVNDKRYVDNGRIITTAGLSAGIDGALHVVELLMGRGYAEEVALSEEYDFNDRAGFVRAALADNLIPNINAGPEYGTWDYESTEGGTDHWQKVFRGTTTKTVRELTDFLEQGLITNGTWAIKKKWVDGTSEWTLKGTDGKPWTGTVSVKGTPGSGNEFTITFKIAKNG